MFKILKINLKFIIIFIFICFLSKSSYAQKSELKIAALLPLSGKYADLGKRILNTIQITIFELDNLDIQIYPFDTKSSNLGAKEAFIKARQKNLNIFVGPITSDTLSSLVEIEGFQKSFFFTFSNKENKVPSNVINFGVNLSSEIEALEGFLKSRKDKIIFFGRDNYFSKIAFEKVKNNVKIKEKYLYKNFKEINSLSLKATNFSYRNKKHLNEIRRLKASGDESDANFAKELEKHDTREGVSFKRVFMPSFNYELIASISFFDFYDADYRSVQFITFNQWFNKKLLIEPSLENLIFPSINLESFKNLNTKYKKIYGHDIQNLEILAFDMIPLIASTWFNKKENYLQISDFQNFTFKGKTGSFKIMQNKANYNLNLYKIKKSKFVKLKKI